MSDERILIVGASASGKTTFARKLGAKLGREVTYIDSLIWKPGWHYIGDETAIAKIREKAQDEEWIIEGFVFKELTQELLERATKIIYLDYSRWVLVLRYVKRSWEHRKEARAEMPGCPDSFSFSFMWRIFMKKEVYWLEKEFSTGKYNQIIVRFRKVNQAESYIDSLGIKYLGVPKTIERT